MELPTRFKNFLKEQTTPASDLTVKNYLADLNHFLRWFEATYQQPFHPNLLTADLANEYRQAGKTAQLSPASLERRLSTLRKFAKFLASEGLIATDPFSTQRKPDEDPCKLKEFSFALREAKISCLTIKNYINDVRQYAEWVGKNDSSVQLSISSLINSDLLSSYRDWLISSSNLSAVSINRKLSSLRRFLSFVRDNGYGPTIELANNVNPNKIHHLNIPNAKSAFSQLEKPSNPQSVENQVSSISPASPKLQRGEYLESGKDKTNEHELHTKYQIPNTERRYSRIAPLRLIQKLGKLATLGLDLSVVALAAVIVEKFQYLSWLASGKQVFKSSTKNGLGLFGSLKDVIASDPEPVEGERGNLSHNGIASHKGLPLSRGASLFTPRNDQSATRYALPATRLSRFHPTHPSFSQLPKHYRVFGHLRHTRPNWYRKYHSYPVVHYFHLAALVILMSGIGFGLYRSFIEKPSQDKILAAPPTAPPRILSFQGRLTDSSDNPITSAKDLRFAIYNDSTASGAALLWQETQQITPDQDGIFSALLGSSTSIPASVFTDNSTLYLGITVMSDPELTPRQQIATVAFAANSETLQGLYPITAGGAGTTNVVLALDSSGNLTIGGSANPTFQATGGSFSLKGTTLNLQTTSGSNGNVKIDPDGQGLINITKPIISDQVSNNRITTAAGAVEIDDLFAVLATSSGQSAFTLNQAGAGPLISASASGVAKFTVDNSGNGIFAGNVAVNGGNITSTGDLTINASGGQLFLTDTQTIAIGGHAGAAYNAISNSGGSPSNPNVTADNDLYVQGDLDVGGTLYLNGSQLTPGALVNYWQRNNGVVAPDQITNDLVLGGTSTSSAKFGFINVGAGTPTATISGNLSLAVPTTAGTNTLSILNGSNLNVVSSVGGDATTTSRLFINGNTGNVGIGTAAPASSFHIGSGQIFVPDGSETVPSISFSSDPDTGIYHHSTTNNLSFTTGGAEQLRITATGKFLLATAGDAAGPTFTLRSDSDTGFFWPTANNFAISTGGGEAIRFDGSGNIGIGTTAPAHKLHLTGAVAGKALAVFNETGDQALFTASASGTTKFVIDNSGNVGIGSTAPTAKLDIQTTGNAKGAVIINGDGNQTLLTASASGSTKFIVDKTGNVGIGTGSPSYYLDVQGGTGIVGQFSGRVIGGSAVNSNEFVTLSQLTGGTGQYWQRANGTLSPTNITDDVLIGGTANATSSALIRLAGTANQNSFFNTGGNVGIGTTAPTQKLEVSGNILASGSRPVTLDSTNGQVVIKGSSGGWAEGYFFDGSAGTDLGGFGALGNVDTMTYYWIGPSYTSPYMTLRSGNVGIGTTTPLAALDIIGDASLSASLVFGTAGTNTIDILNGDRLAIQTSPGGDAGLTERITIASSGNLGIGDSTPDGPLRVVRSLSLSGLTGNQYAGLVSSPTFTGTADSTAAVGGFGLYSVTTTNASKGVQSLTTYGQYIYNDLANGNFTNTMYGGYFTSRNSSATAGGDGISTSTATVSAAIRGDAINNAAGTVANQYGGILYSYNNSTGNITSNYGASIATYNASSGTVTTNYGIYSTAFQSGTTAMTTNTAGYFDSYNEDSTGTIDTTVGVRSRARGSIANAGLITTAYGLLSDVATTSGTTTGGINTGIAGRFDITSPMNTTAYGVYSNVTGIGTGTNYGVYVNTTGSVTNNYGIRVTGTTASAGNYALYVDAAAKNYFAGNVGIGSTAPTQALDIAGALTVTSAGLLTTSSNIAVNGGNITSTGDLTINASGGQLFLTDTQTIAIGGHAGAAYNAISNSGGTPTNPNVTADNDLYIQGDLDIGGTLYVAGTQIANYWQRNNGTVEPTNITDDLLLGGISTASAKFGFINVGAGTPTATISGNLSLAVPTTAGTNTLSILNGSNLNVVSSVGGDAVTTSRLFINGNTGNVGLGTTTPATALDVKTGSSNRRLFITDTLGSYGASADNQIQVSGSGLRIRTGANAVGTIIAGTITDNGDGTTYSINSGGVQLGSAVDLLWSSTSVYSGTKDLGVERNAAGILKVTNGSTGFGTLTAGNIGIGSTTPANALDVVGNTSITGYATVSASLAVGYSSVQAGTGNGVFSGNVGIGSTAPTQKLDVAGSIALQNSNTLTGVSGYTQFSSGLSVGGATTYYINSSGTGNLNALTLAGNLDVNGTSNDIAGTLNLSGNTLTSSGDLTINPTGGDVILSDTDTLNIGGNASDVAYNIIGDSTTGATAAMNADNDLFVQGDVDIAGALTVGGTTIANYWQRNSGALAPANITDDILLGAIATASATVRLGATTNADSFFNTGGNVGIGTTNPQAKVEINLGSAGGFEYIRNSGANEWGLQLLGAGATPIAGFTANGATGEVRVGGLTTNYFPTFYSNGSEAMRITTTGNVGIGSTAPTAKLDVEMTGNAKGAVIINGDGNQTLFTASSSGNTRFIVDKTGNVGIGTTLPRQEFDLIGDALFSGNVGIGTTVVTSSLVNIENSVGGVEIQGANESMFNLYTQGSMTFRIDSDNDTANTYAFYNGANTEIASLDELGNLQADGSINIDGTSNDIAGTLNLSGNTLTSSGDLTINPTGGDVILSDTDTLNIGGNASDVAYNIIGDSTTGATAAMNADNDLFVQGDVDIAGALTVGGTTIANYWQRNSGALAPANITDDILLGAIATASATVRLGATTNAHSYFNTGGNVGIGTTAPNNKLEVNGGKIYHTDGAVTTELFAASSTSKGYVGTFTNNPFVIRTNDADRITVDTAGNVGIGEAAPISKLEVRQSSTGTGFGGTSGTGAVRVSFSTGYGVGIDTWDSGTPRWGILNYSGDTPTVMMEGTYNSNNVVFNSGGNVGVGTTTPTGKFNVDGAITGKALSILNQNGGDQAVLTASISGATKFIVAATNGNVGINTATPGQELDVNGDVLLAGGGTIDTRAAGTLTIGGTTQTGLTLGRAGTTTTISSSSWNVSSTGVASGLTGLTSSGTITFSGLTASRAVFTTTGGQLTSTGASADLASSLSDETGTGVVVFGTSPAITTSLTTGSLSFDLINTSATTVNFAGASTALTIGATTGTATIRNATTALSGNLTIAGTTGITASGTGAGLNFSGTGTHTVQATSSTLALAATGANTITLATNGSTRWTVTSAGVLESNGTQTIQTSTGNLTLATAAGNGHIILSPNGTGNVGIGTSTPTAAKLTVNGTIAGSQLYDFDNASYYLDPAATGTALNLAGDIAAAGTTGLTLSGAGAGITFSGSGTHTIQATSSTLALAATGANIMTFSTNGAEAMRLASDGNLGIGTTDTSIFKTTVYGTTNSKGLFGVLGDGNQTLFTASVSGATRFLVNQSGNVGINTTAPSNLLDVYMSNGNTATGQIMVEQGSTGNSLINFARTSTAYYSVGISGTTFKIDYVGAAGLTSPATNANFNITNAGNVGIGTGTPGQLLDVQGFFQFNLDGSAGANTTGVCKSVADSTGTESNVELQDCSSTPGDYAEFYPTQDGVGAGDVVSMTDEMFTYSDDLMDIQTGLNLHQQRQVTVPVLKKAVANEMNHIFGIVSTNPFQPLGRTIIEQGANNPLPIALSGRVPLKVTIENGIIKKGDPLTVSSIPGVATKAVHVGVIVGRALEDYSGSGVGTIMAQSGTSYYDPSVQIAQSGNLTVTGSDEGSFTAWAGQYKFENKGGFADAIIARLTAGIVKTQQLVVHGTSTFLGNVQMQALNVASTIQASSINASAIAVESLSIGGKSIRDYVAVIVNDILNTQYQIQDTGFASPVANIDQVNTNLISPLSPDKPVQVAGDLTIKKTASSAGNLTVEGNASISGALAGTDASFSGTLRAGHIIADQIDGLEARIASIAANNLTASSAAITNIYNIYNTASESGTLAASGSGTASSSGTFVTGDPYSLVASSIYTDVADISSLSASLAYLPNLTTETQTVRQGLMVFGTTSLADTAVTGQFSINGSLILADNSINVLGSTFEIQPLRQGNVSFMGGLVAIDTDGNLSVSGNASFAKDVTIAGTLQARIVSPVPSEDLVIQLPGSDADQGTLAVDRPGVTIKNGSGSAVLKITDVGDVIASGAGKFAQLAADSLQVVRGAQADTSLSETIATSSAGTATIKANRYERTIISPYVTEKSLIYITAVTDTGGVAPFIARQVPRNDTKNIQGSFTIRIPVLQSKDVKVNWWVVN